MVLEGCPPVTLALNPITVRPAGSPQVFGGREGGLRPLLDDLEMACPFLASVFPPVEWAGFLNSG